jgi:D-amino peptidase
MRRQIACAGVAIVLVLALTGCAGGESEPPPATAPTMGIDAGRILENPAPNGDGELRVLVYHDMEGLSGQNDWRTFDYGRQLYTHGRQLLTDDVNAVIEGLFAGGADAVDVVDAHGSGSPDPDLLLDQLDDRARPIYRDTPFRPYVDLAEPGVYDAVAVVGMHAKTGSGGFASHTYTLGMDWILNGMSVTETEIIGFAWGRVGVPVIFASGDDRLRADLETMPWVEYVVTKRATSASTADLRPIDEVHAEMRNAAQRALEQLPEARSMRLVEPVAASLRVVPPADLSPLSRVPGIDYEDQTVTFEAADFQAAYDGVTGLINVASAAYFGVLEETLGALPENQQIMMDFEENLLVRWLDVESGRWSPADAAAQDAGRQYHGAR